MQRHSSVIAPLALASNGTRRVTGSGAGGLLSEDEKRSSRGRAPAFRIAWKAGYSRPLIPEGHIVVMHVPWFVDEDGCGGFTCPTRSGVRWFGRCATPRPATKRTPCTPHRARLPRALIGSHTRKPPKRQRRDGGAPVACACAGAEVASNYSSLLRWNAAFPGQSNPPSISKRF